MTCHSRTTSYSLFGLKSTVKVSVVKITYSSFFSEIKPIHHQLESVYSHAKFLNIFLLKKNNENPVVNPIIPETGGEIWHNLLH